MKTYTIEQIKNYLNTQDSFGDIFYNLSEANIDIANLPDELINDEFEEENIDKANQEELETIELVQTCGACPEQYEAFIKNKQVGYLRLRHGVFSVESPDCGGEIIYEATLNGDGIFDEDERDYYLNAAKSAILKHIKSNL